MRLGKIVQWIAALTPPLVTITGITLYAEPLADTALMWADVYGTPMLDSGTSVLPRVLLVVAILLPSIFISLLLAMAASCALYFALRPPPTPLRNLSLLAVSALPPTPPFLYQDGLHFATHTGPAVLYPQLDDADATLVTASLPHRQDPVGVVRWSRISAWDKPGSESYSVCSLSSLFVAEELEGRAIPISLAREALAVYAQNVLNDPLQTPASYAVVVDSDMCRISRMVRLASSAWDGPVSVTKLVYYTVDAERMGTLWDLLETALAAPNGNALGVALPPEWHEVTREDDESVIPLAHLVWDPDHAHDESSVISHPIPDRVHMFGLPADHPLVSTLKTEHKLDPVGKAAALSIGLDDCDFTFASTSTWF